MKIKKKIKRLKYTQIYADVYKDGFSEWSEISTKKQFDCCCGCGLVHEHRYAVYRPVRRKGKIAYWTLVKGARLMRTVRLAPRRTAGVRRGKEYRHVAKAIKSKRV